MSLTLQKSIAAALRKGAGSDGTPTAEQVTLINGYALRDFKAEELYTREFIVCHNAIDRDGEVIDEALLDSIVKTLPGKGLFIKHPLSYDGDSGPGEGIWFTARSETMSLASAADLMRVPDLKLPHDRSQVKVVFGSMYMPRHASKEKLISDIDSGVANFVSIGFGAAGRADVINPATKSREAVRLLGPGSAYEASLVWLGAQPGARTLKTVKETDMSAEVLAALKLAIGPHAVLLDTPASLKAVLDESATHKAAGATLVGLKAALGDNAVLLDSPADLAALVKAGRDYQTGLVDDLIKADRTATPPRCGDKPEEVEAARKQYAAYAVPQLKHLHGLLVKAAPVATLEPGDPNATKPAPGGNEKGATAPAALDFLG